MSGVLLFTITGSGRLSYLVGASLGFYTHKASPTIRHLTQSIKCPRLDILQAWDLVGRHFGWSGSLQFTIAKSVDENSD